MDLAGKKHLYNISLSNQERYNIKNVSFSMLFNKDWDEKYKYIKTNPNIGNYNIPHERNIK